MKPAPFSYHRARSLQDVVALFETCGQDAKILAGGQSLGPMMNMRLAQPAHVIDINGIGDLSFIREEGERIAIGALTRHREVETSTLVRAACPVLARAAETVGHYAIRQRGTFGGSLAHGDPAAQFPLLATLLGAEFELLSRRGVRRMPAADFFLSVFTTALDPDEILTLARFPRLAQGEGWGFRMLSRRAGDFAIAAVAATLRLDRSGRVKSLRLAVGAVEATPKGVDDVAADSLGRMPDAAWAWTVAAAVAERLDPMDDPRTPAEFRRELAGVLVRRALGDCIETARAG